jgi:hypothetical protein
VAPAEAEAEGAEARWCRREGLSAIALRAVRDTADAVLAVLSKTDLREGFWDPRNLCCPPALAPVRSRPVGRELGSVCDPVGDGAAVRALRELLEALAFPPAAAPPEPEPAQAEELLVGQLEEVLRLQICSHRIQAQLKVAAAGGAGAHTVLREVQRRLSGVPVCTFFLGGSCRGGAGAGSAYRPCAFRHVLLSGERPPSCRWMGSAEGCRFGAACRFDHGAVLDAPGWHPRMAATLAAGMRAGRAAYDAVVAEQRRAGPHSPG